MRHVAVDATGLDTPPPSPDAITSRTPPPAPRPHHATLKPGPPGEPMFKSNNPFASLGPLPPPALPNPPLHNNDTSRNVDNDDEELRKALAMSCPGGEDSNRHERERSARAKGAPPPSPTSEAGTGPKMEVSHPPEKGFFPSEKVDGEGKLAMVPAAAVDSKPTAVSRELPYPLSRFVPALKNLGNYAPFERGRRSRSRNPGFFDDSFFPFRLCRQSRGSAYFYSPSAGRVSIIPSLLVTAYVGLRPTAGHWSCIPSLGVRLPQRFSFRLCWPSHNYARPSPQTFVLEISTVQLQRVGKQSIAALQLALELTESLRVRYATSPFRAIRE